jgi:hypothetical protein
MVQENLSARNSETKEFTNSFEKVKEIAEKGITYFKNPAIYSSKVIQVERNKSALIYYKNLIVEELEKVLEQANGQAIIHTKQQK